MVVYEENGHKLPQLEVLKLFLSWPALSRFDLRRLESGEVAGRMGSEAYRDYKVILG